MKIQSDRRRVLLILVFAIFAGFLLWQHHYVSIYQDDYAYASLSYANIEPNVIGQNFTLAQLIHYLVQQYQSWCGRVLYFGIEILLLKAGLPAFQIVQSIMIVLLYWFAYQASRSPIQPDSQPQPLVALAGVATFGLLPANAYRTGIYWATASVPYVFPMAIWFGVILLQERLRRSWDTLPAGKRWSGVALACLGYFAAAFSQEQIALMVVFYAAAYAVWHMAAARKFQFQTAMPGLAAAAGLTVLFLAPGNVHRMDETPDFYSLSIFRRALVNLPEIAKMYLRPGSRLTILLLAIVSILASALVIRLVKAMPDRSRPDQDRRIAALAKLNIGSSLAGLVAFLAFGNDIRTSVSILLQMNHARLVKIMAVPLGLGAGLLVLLALAMVYLALARLRHVPGILALTGALGTQAAMLNTPYVTERMMLPLAFVLAIVLMALVRGIFAAPGLQAARAHVRTACLALAVLASINLAWILAGYSVNAPYLRRNDAALRTAAATYQSGRPVAAVELEKLPRLYVDYAGDQPYDNSFKYIEVYMKRYYGLPAEVQLVWR